MLALLVSFFPVFSMVTLSFGVVLPDIREELGFGLSAAGLLSSASWMLPAVLGVPLTLFAVRFRPKPLYLMVIAIASVLLIAQATAINFSVLLISRLAFSLIAPLMFTAGTLFRTQWIPKRELGLVMGIQFGTIMLGQAASLIALPAFISILGGWRPTFAAYAVFSVFLLVIWILFGKERDSEEYMAERRLGKPSASFMTIFKYREFWMLGVAIFGNVIPQMAIFAFWPTFLIEVRNVNIQMAGLMLAIFPLGGFVSALTVGPFSDRIGLRKPLIWPFGLLCPITYCLLMLDLPIGVLCIVSFVGGFFALAPVTPSLAVPFELPDIKPSEVAVGASFQNMIQAFGFFLGPLLVGVLAESIFENNLIPAMFAVSIAPLTVTIMGLAIRETGHGRKVRKS